MLGPCAGLAAGVIGAAVRGMARTFRKLGKGLFHLLLHVGGLHGAKDGDDPVVRGQADADHVATIGEFQFRNGFLAAQPGAVKGLAREDFPPRFSHGDGERIFLFLDDAGDLAFLDVGQAGLRQ